MRSLFLSTTAAALLLSSGAQAATLRYAAAGDIYGLDPHSMTDSFTNGILAHVYEPLVRYAPDLSIEPALATSWETIEPARVRYFLRQDVTFHDGAPFTAQDVAASLLRATHPDSPIRGNLPALKDVEVVDDYTVDLILEGPSPLLNNYLTNIGIMDREWMEANGSLDPVDQQKGEEGFSTSNANGTGPFKVESRRPDALTVFVKNEGWWDEPVHNLDRIEFSPIASAATRVAALLSGEIDLITPAPLQDLDRIDAAPGVRVLESPGLRTIMLAVNLKDQMADGSTDGNPLQDVRVRRAIMHATNMDGIRDRIMRGKSRNAGTLIAPEVPGFVEALNERPAHDPDAARALLEEAGYGDGFALNLNCPNDAYVNDAAICQSMVPMLAQVGIEARLVVEPRSLHFQKAQAGEVDLFMLGWATLPMLDGFSVISAMLAAPDDKFGTWNMLGYNNERINELNRAIEVELDEEKRQAMMAEAFTIAAEELPWLPLHQQPISWAARDNVEIAQAADDIIRLWHATVN